MGIRVRWRSWILLLLTKSSTSSYPKISHLLTVFFAVCCQSCFFWFECLFVAEKGGDWLWCICNWVKCVIFSQAILLEVAIFGLGVEAARRLPTWNWENWATNDARKVVVFYSDYTTHLWINNRFSIIYKSYKLIRVTRGCLPTISMIWMSCCHCFGAIRQCQCLGRSAGQQWI